MARVRTVLHRMHKLKSIEIHWVVRIPARVLQRRLELQRILVQPDILFMCILLWYISGCTKLVLVMALRIDGS